jgi:hypothetical protein
MANQQMKYIQISIHQLAFIVYSLHLPNNIGKYARRPFCHVAVPAAESVMMNIHRHISRPTR